ncbi:hypothetical protein AALO_G00192610 [Alosa alosa]|uniref:Uncharacterized protein n=1 Tax=Alosa alosa TaxID=278164 RepID=A0AAV6G8J9_9TELE|nr:hypothetical protein AALO_G00192610 [Alosa alosa]
MEAYVIYGSINTHHTMTQHTSVPSSAPVEHRNLNENINLTGGKTIDRTSVKSNGLKTSRRQNFKQNCNFLNCLYCIECWLRSGFL